MSNFVEITDAVLDVGEITKKVTSSSTGAIALFIGTTRDHFEGKKVVKLEYEAFETMARKELLKVCDKIRGKWKVSNIAIYHRLGVVEVCEASVIIAVSSEHRKEALEAVHFAIDDLKTNVPIWKKEVYADGSIEAEWKQNKECHWRLKKDSQRDNLEFNIEKANVDMDDVQITCSNEELNRRISAFSARKREEINNSNVMEFCNRYAGYDDLEKDTDRYTSCARTDATHIHRRDGSKSHLHFSVVKNPSGPQTGDFMDKKYDPVMAHSMDKDKIKIKTETGYAKDLPVGLAERFHGLEAKLLVEGAPIPKDIYARLKALEDRMNFLEGVSPEYFSDFAKKTSDSQVNSASGNYPSQDDSLNSINAKIQELQDCLRVKVKQEPE